MGSSWIVAPLSCSPEPLGVLGSAPRLISLVLCGRVLVPAELVSVSILVLASRQFVILGVYLSVSMWLGLTWIFLLKSCDKKHNKWLCASSTMELCNNSANILPPKESSSGVTDSYSMSLSDCSSQSFQGFLVPSIEICQNAALYSQCRASLCSRQDFLVG